MNILSILVNYWKKKKEEKEKNKSFDNLNCIGKPWIALVKQSRKKGYAKSIPAIDQLINWCAGSSSCFWVLWDVDNDTINDDNPTKSA